MKKTTLFSLTFFLAFFYWALNPAMKRAEAITTLKLISPSDSIKMKTETPTFKWESTKDPGFRETRKKYHIVVARDRDLTERLWEDSTIDHPTQSIVYDGPPFEEWMTYFWSVRVQVDSLRMDSTHTTFWYRFVRARTFFYTGATIIEIPDTLHNLFTIREGILWATAGDTVLVKPGTYYENLEFHRKGVTLASYFARDGDTTTIKNTIIDGDSLTRGDVYGSVIYFTSDADSSSGVIGFTIRNGRGSKVEMETGEKVNGGGIFCELGSTPTIAYNVITQNRAPDDGGGIFCYKAGPNIFKNIITQNTAGGSGGAIQCYLSIRTKPQSSSRRPGGEGEENLGFEIMPKTDPKHPSTGLDSKAEKDDLENSLYPRDATQVFSALSSDPLAKPAQNPPVAVLNYHVRRDTIVQREKILVGDTIVLDGSESFDPDGDPIKRYRWKGERWQKCENPDDWKTYNVTSGTMFDIVEIAVTEEMGGRYRIWLIVETGSGAGNADTSEIISLNLQRAPRITVAEDTLIAIGDTGWLDGSGSCDINPDDDTTLSFLWTQVDGPVSVAIIDSESVKAHFIAYDETYGGEHIFQLRISDSDTISLDTQKVIVDRFPEAATFDSLAGFVVDDSLPLDGSKSFDPDSGLGDSVIYFIWKGISHITCEDTSAFSITDSLDSTKQVQKIPASEGGGIYQVCLYVRDKYGVRSKNTDTLLISVQLPPVPDAGPDTIILPGRWVTLHGDVKCEVNWDQVDSLKYAWFQDTLNPAFPELQPQDPLGKTVRFFTGTPGIYRFYLRVTDTELESGPDDVVRVIINTPPLIDSTSPNPNEVKFAEGDTVALKVWAHDDTAEVRIFGDTLIVNWTATYWPGYPDDDTYKPEIMGSENDTARFVPLKHGEYRFQVVVHDTISQKQYLSGAEMDTLNRKEFRVWVDTTFAYPSIMGNLISFNTADSKGGGIDCYGSSPDIINNIFYKNKSSSSGGGICSRYLSAPHIQRNIFFGNISGDSTGGAVADLKAEFSPAATIGYRAKTVIETNDFWNNAGGDVYQPPADLSGNIYLYPRLIDPEYGDFRLECSSPCLDDSIGLLLWLYPDTCDQVPPLTMISLSLFQHPVATAVAHFLVNTDVPLKAPPVGYVTLGENPPAVVDFISISSTTYRGNFFFTTSDTARVSIFASTVQEQDTSISRAFAVQLIEPGKMGKLVSHDSRLRVLFPQGAVKADIYATCIPVSDDPKYSFEDEEKVALGGAYHLGPPSDFKKELTISFTLDGYDLTEKDKSLFSIYRYEKNGWEKQESFLYENSICAKVRSLGIFRLVYDAEQEHITGIPRTYQLFQNYPNPFNPQTMIKYDLPNPGHVNVTIYNILGQKVKTLVNEHQEAGHKWVNWDGKDDGGKEVASGIYFYKIKTAEFEKTKKMVLLK